MLRSLATEQDGKPGNCSERNLGGQGGAAFEPGTESGPDGDSDSTHSVWSDSSRELATRRRIQILSYWDVFLVHLMYSAIIPEAYSLALALGEGAAFSGWLIAAQWGATAVGTLLIARPFITRSSHAAQKNAALLGVTLVGLANLCFGISIGFSHVLGLSDGEVAVISVTTRMLTGVAWAVSTMVISVASVEVTPKSERVTNEVWRQFAIVMGLGCGPLASASVTRLFQMEDTLARVSAIAYFVVVLYAGFFFLVVHMLPTDRSAAEAPPNPSVANETTPLLQGATARKWHFLASSTGVLFGLLRAFITSSIESGSAFILQTEFGWAPPVIGIVVGSTFCFTAFTLMALATVQPTLKADDCVLHIAALIALGGVCLLLPSVGASPVLIVSADFLIFAASFCAGSIAEGRGLEHAQPGSLLSVENIWVIRNAGKNNISRFMGPPLARMTLEFGGRGAYAVAMLITMGIGWAMLVTLSYAHWQANGRRSWFTSAGARQESKV